MQRRIESGVVILIGVGLIALTLFTQLFTRAPAFEELTDDFRPLMTDKAIAQMHTDLEGMQAMTTEMNEGVLPFVMESLQMDPVAFEVYTQQNFPATTQGMEQLPGITEQFTGMGHTLALQQENFEAADAIPTSSIPATVFPWGLVAVAALAIGIGYMMLRTMNLGAYLALVLGILMIAGAFLMSWPSKTSAADDMNGAFRGVLTQEQAAGAQGALAVVAQMDYEMQNQMLPALATEMDMSTPDLTAYLGENFPAVGAMLESSDEVQARFDGMVSTMLVNIDNYETIKPLSMEPINWFFIVSGLLIAIAGGLALFAPAPSPRHRPAIIAH